uniref:Transmembrane protein n=1 Tax=Mycobacterium sp. (strain JLS) TaxID=164757 RepID=A0A5Q5CB95_MYCSJ
MADNGNEHPTGEHTSPYLPTFDTGGFSQPDPVTPLAARPEPTLTLDREPDPLAYEALDFEPDSEPMVVPPAQPIVLPGSYQFLKRWLFALVLSAVWVVAAAVGAGLYYWWVGDLDPDKTWPVYVVLVYLLGCTVAGLIVAMVARKPVVTALAIALMSAPPASTAGAAALYGAYVFGWIAH